MPPAGALLALLPSAVLHAVLVLGGLAWSPAVYNICRSHSLPLDCFGFVFRFGHHFAFNRWRYCRQAGSLCFVCSKLFVLPFIHFQPRSLPLLLVGKYIILTIRPGYSFAFCPTMERNYHHDALCHFVQMPVTYNMVQYLARESASVIHCDSSAVQGGGQQDAAAASIKGAGTLPPLPTLEEFICSLINRSHVETATLMTSLVYLARLRARLPPMARGMRCTPHRIFLATLIMAAKDVNDASPKNKHWARYTTVKGYPGFEFGVPEVNLMERQLLALLEWDVRVEEADLLDALDPFLAPIRERLVVLDIERGARVSELEARERAAKEREWAEQDQEKERKRCYEKECDSSANAGPVLEPLLAIVSPPLRPQSSQGDHCYYYCHTSPRYQPRARTSGASRRSTQSVSPPSVTELPLLGSSVSSRTTSSSSQSDQHAHRRGPYTRDASLVRSSRVSSWSPGMRADTDSPAMMSTAPTVDLDDATAGIYQDDYKYGGKGVHHMPYDCEYEAECGGRHDHGSGYAGDVSPAVRVADVDGDADALGSDDLEAEADTAVLVNCAAITTTTIAINNGKPSTKRQQRQLLNRKTIDGNGVPADPSGKTKSSLSLIDMASATLRPRAVPRVVEIPPSSNVSRKGKRSSMRAATGAAAGGSGGGAGSFIARWFGKGNAGVSEQAVVG